MIRRRQPIRRFRASKLRNVPTRDVTGALRQSRKEADVGSKLHAAQQAGAICDLRAQVRYRLDVYRQDRVEELLRFIESTFPDGTAPRIAVSRIRESKVHVSSYVVDYQFSDPKTGMLQLLDPKGRREGDAWQRFVTKQRLMLACHGLTVEVV